MKQETDIEKTRVFVSEITGYFDLVEREEQTIKSGPREDDLEPYLNSIGRCKRAMEVLSGTRLRASEKAMGQLKQILKAATLQLEELFRTWLIKWSDPIEPAGYVLNNKPIPTIPEQPLDQLTRLCSYLSGSDIELGYASDYIRVYSEVRGTYLTRSLTSLAQASINTAEKRNTPVYEKGTCGFISYTDALVRMFETEYAIAEIVLPPDAVSQGFRGAMQPALDAFVDTGKQLQMRIKKNMQTDVFLAFDMLETLNNYQPSFDELFRLAGSKDSGHGELMHSLRGVALRSFPEFLDDIKSNPSKTPPDGTVHEITIMTIQQMKRLADYQETVELMLVTLGDGNWNASGVDPNFTRDRTGRPVVGNAIMRHYFADCLDTLATSLESKARSYKRPAPTSIFLLNNYHYMLKTIRAQFSLLVEPEVEEKYEKLVKLNGDSYQNTWKPCFNYLMDFTYTRGKASSEKQSAKERVKNFNNEFDENYKVHKSYSIPDFELRNKIIADIKGVLMPLYNRFLERHQQSEFAKNPAKYIRYSPDVLEGMLGRLFDGLI